jgi:hypothetical protein
MRMRNRLILVTFGCGLAIFVAAVSVAFGLAPAWVVALTSLFGAAGIATVVIHGKGSANRSEKYKRTSRGSIVWPLALLVGGALGIVDVVRDGWHVGDGVGVAVWLIMLLVYVLAYRKQRKDGSGL